LENNAIRADCADSIWMVDKPEVDRAANANAVSAKSPLMNYLGSKFF
jgi:hypothetical protein